MRNDAIQFIRRQFKLEELGPNGVCIFRAERGFLEA